MFCTSCWEGLKNSFPLFNTQKTSGFHLKRNTSSAVQLHSSQTTLVFTPTAWSFSDSHQQEKRDHSNAYFQHKLAHAEDVISPALKELPRKKQSQLFYLKITL